MGDYAGLSILSFCVIPQNGTHPNRAAMLQEVAAYEAMHNELLANHAGEFVAIYQGKLVDFDKNEVALLDRRRHNYRNQVVLIRRVEADPQPELVYRSPRFA